MSAWLLSCTAALTALLVTPPAHASCDERPGTPNELVAEPLSPTAIRLSWKNTTGRAAGAGAVGHTMYFDIYVRDLDGQDLGRDVTGVGPYRNLAYGSRSYHEFGDLAMGTDYCFFMRARSAAGTQGCVSQEASAAVCTATTVPPGSVANGCKSGFVWRTATPADDVCVKPEVRAQTLADNKLAHTRRVGPPRFNPDTCPVQNRKAKACWSFDIPCIDPYVWRRATPDDYVCVTTDAARQAASDNARAGERRPVVASATALPPPPPNPPDEPAVARTCSGQLYSQASNFEIFYSNANGCAQPDVMTANSLGEAMMCGRTKYGDAFEEATPQDFRVATTGPSGCQGYTIKAGSEDKALQCATSQCGVGCESAIGECL